MEELKYILYITVNLCNGKFYIGVHKTNPETFDGYIGCGIYRQSQATEDNAFHRAVKKYGYENFQRTTIKIFPGTDDGKESAFALEKTLVNETLLKSKTSYNTSIGGLGGNIVENKTVFMFDLKGNYLRSFKNVREAAIYINNENVYSTLKSIRNNCLGTSKSSNGYYWSYKKEFDYNNQKMVPIAQYTLSGKFLRSFESLTQAEVELKLNSIYQAIVKKGSCGGFQWRYYNEDNSDISPLMNKTTKLNNIPIIMYDKNMNLIKEFESINACKETYPDLTVGQITRVLNKIIKTHKGYIFKYKDEDIV